MTNKFRRSVTSVLLAASLLFSSQSVIAFADYGSKSDTSDLSPVQESVEPVIGESQAMMAAPIGYGHCIPHPAESIDSWAHSINIDYECETLDDLYENDELEHAHDDNSTIRLSAFSYNKDYTINWKSGCETAYVQVSREQADAFVRAYNNKFAEENGTHWLEKDEDDEDDWPKTVKLKYQRGCWQLDDEDDDIDIELECDGEGGETGEITNELQKAINDLDVMYDCNNDFGDWHGFVIKLKDVNAQIDQHYTVAFNNDKTQATISILNSDSFWMNVYNERHHIEHYFVKVPDSEAILYKEKNGTWTTHGDDKGDFNITITCKEPDPTTPEKPDAPKLDKLLGNVSVVCDTAPESHNTSYSFKDLSEGAEYTVTEPTPIAGQKDTYQCTVTVNDEKVLEKYNGETGTHTHTLAETGSNLGPVTLTWKNNEWTVDNAVTDSLTVKIHCESEPWTPIVPFPTDDNIKVLLNGKIKVVCETVKAHGEKTYGAEVEGGYTPSNEIKVDGTNYTYDLTINYNPYVAQYNDDDTSAKHGLVESDVFSETVTLTWVPNNKELTGGHWAIDDNLLVTIPVQCEYPTLDQDDLANLWVNFFCINDETHNKEHWTNLASCTAEIDYHIEYDKEGSAEVTLLKPEQFAKAYCDSTLKVPHLYIGYEPESLTLHWNGENWVSYEISRSSDANSFTIGILCGPSIARINELLNAQIICVNDDAKHQKTASFDNLLDYSFDVTNLKNDNSVVTAEVVVKPSLYLDKFYNISGGIEHSVVIDNETYPVNEDGSVTVRFSYTGEWNLLYPTRNMVTFPVKCTTQKPIDNPDWEDISALFNDYVTVDCTTGGHNPISYSLVESEVQIGNVYSAAPIVGEESTTYFVPITFNTPDNIRNRVISAYDNSTPNTHSYQSGSIPASITLRYDNENKVWVNEDVKNVLFTVTCTTGGGTIDPNPNPGGGGDNDDDDDRYTGDNTVTRTINDDDVPLNDRPINTTTIDDEDVPLADLPDDTVTIDDGEVPLKDNPSTGDSLPFAAMAAAALSLGGVIVLNRKKK